jgi:hypothetical protein
MAPPVIGNAAQPLFGKRRHLVTPGIRRQRPARQENDRRTLAPISREQVHPSAVRTKPPAAPSEFASRIRFSSSRSARSNQGQRDGAITSEVSKLDGIAVAQPVRLIRAGDTGATGGFEGAGGAQPGIDPRHGAPEQRDPGRATRPDQCRRQLRQLLDRAGTAAAYADLVDLPWRHPLHHQRLPPHEARRSACATRCGAAYLRSRRRHTRGCGRRSSTPDRLSEN